MRKIRIGEAREGQVVAADVFDPSLGRNFSLLLGQGVVLTRDYIKKLKNHGVSSLLIEVPADYRGSAGETFEISAVKADIIVEGKVLVKCDVPPHTKIEAGESVVINGHVFEGCMISSKKGGVVVRGAICGTKDDPVRITSFQNLFVHSSADQSVLFGDLIAEKDINVVGGIGYSSLSCKGELRVEGKAVRSQLHSQARIKIYECGAEAQEESCILVVRPAECQVLSQELLRLDSRLSDLAMEKEKLRNIIDLIKRLGKDISRLPEDQKTKLTSTAMRYRDMEAESASLQHSKNQIKEEIEKSVGVRRIMVSGDIYPGSRVSIENFSVALMKKESSVAFYVKDCKMAFSRYDGR